MSVAISSATPTTFGAGGGSIAISGTFEPGESPFDVYLEHQTTFDLVAIGSALTSPDDMSLSATVPTGVPSGSYTLSVFGSVTFDAWATPIEVTGATYGVTGVSPASLSVDGGTLTVTGLFELGLDYYAELRQDGTEIDLVGPVQPTDGTTLVFELSPVTAAEIGIYELFVFVLVDDTIEEDVDGSATFEVTASTRPVFASGRGGSGLMTQFGAFLPHEYCGVEPLAAGLAAAVALAEAGADSLREQVTVELGADAWLTFAAQGQGIRRATAETDGSLRIRMRSVDDQLTRPVLQTTVDTLLETDNCQILEWWEHSYLDVELEGEGGLWLDSERLSGGPSSFLILVPERGWLSAGTYLDAELWLGRAFLGTSPEGGVYAAIINAVNRARAAGVFWRLCLID